MIPLTGFNSLVDLIKAFPNEQSCIDHLERIRWNANVVSPFDPSSKVYKCKGNKYKCKTTGKYFNVRTSTIFEDTKMPLQKWFIALYIFSSHKKGISSHQLAKDLDITQKSAWFVLHRLRYAFDHPAFKKMLSKTVEIDETYIGGKEHNKHASKKKYAKGQKRINNKAAVFGMVDRESKTVIASHVDFSDDGVTEYLVTKYVSQEATLISDNSDLYNPLKEYYDHQIINHGAKEYVRGMAHTNTIEGFWSQLKRGVDGIYHWVSVKHLQRYVQEYALRYNTRTIREDQRFNVVLTNMVGRLTYADLIRKKHSQKSN
ncbi:MAG: IS1595 family transposase [Bacteroidota bacterium]